MPRRYRRHAAAPSANHDVAHIAAGYLRESTRKQGEATLEVQRAKIKQEAHRRGLEIPEELWATDVERGRVVTRQGYQRVLEWAREGRIGNVIVFTLSRLGRSAPERLRMTEEMHALGVNVYSVLQGQDTPGLLSGVNAVVDEEASRQLARVVRPNKEAAARAGISMGPTPFGYERVYELLPGRKRPIGLLRPHPDEAAIVRDRVYGRYARGDISLRALARELTDDPAVPRPRKGERWYVESLRHILSNQLYLGRVSYNERATGYYDRCGPDDYFEAEGLHEGLIDPDTFARVQSLLTLHANRPGVLRREPGAALLSGVARCHVCGGPMSLSGSHYGTVWSYVCNNTSHGGASCRQATLQASLAHRAVLDEMVLLEARDLGPRPLRRAAKREDEGAARLVAVRREIEEWKRRAARHAEGLEHFGDATYEEREAFRAAARRFAAETRAREDEERRLMERQGDTGRVLEAHRRLTADLRRPTWRALLIAPEWDVERDPVARTLTREMILATMSAARLAWRDRPHRPTRLTMAIEWRSDVEALLEMGALAHPHWPPERSGGGDD